MELGPESVIGANVIVGDGASIQQSTVMEKTRVGQYVNLNNRFVNKKMLISVANEQDTYVTDDFLLDEVQLNIVASNLQQGIHAVHKNHFLSGDWVTIGPQNVEMILNDHSVPPDLLSESCINNFK